ncbi:MAG: hypothetical protein WC717_04505 [Candidatus Micrarchaeia archaeon]|jgi:hypothetical protein
MPLVLIMHFHPAPSGGHFSYGPPHSAPRQAEAANLKPFYALLDSLGNKFLQNASIIPPKAGNGDIGRYVHECHGGKYVGKVACTMAISLDRLDELKAFATAQADSGMLLAARSGKLFVIDPKL